MRGRQLGSPLLPHSFRDALGGDVFEQFFLFLGQHPGGGNRRLGVAGLAGVGLVGERVPGLFTQFEFHYLVPDIVLDIALPYMLEQGTVPWKKSIAQVDSLCMPHFTVPVKFLLFVEARSEVFLGLFSFCKLFFRSLFCKEAHFCANTEVGH